MTRVYGGRNLRRTAQSLSHSGQSAEQLNQYEDQMRLHELAPPFPG